MTVKELQQLVYLEKIIRHEQERLNDLRASLSLRSPGLSDMPKAPGARDRIGDAVPDIVDQTAKIERDIRKYQDVCEQLRAYIDSVPFARIRLIMTLRFIDLKTWQEVADEIGEKETEYSVKKAVYRYLNDSSF